MEQRKIDQVSRVNICTLPLLTYIHIDMYSFWLCYYFFSIPVMFLVLHANWQMFHMCNLTGNFSIIIFKGISGLMVVVSCYSIPIRCQLITKQNQIPWLVSCNNSREYLGISFFLFLFPSFLLPSISSLIISFFLSCLFYFLNRTLKHSYSYCNTSQNEVHWSLSSYSSSPSFHFSTFFL